MRKVKLRKGLESPKKLPLCKGGSAVHNLIRKRDEPGFYCTTCGLNVDEKPE